MEEKEVALCSASLLGGLFSLYVLLLSRDIPSLSLARSLCVSTVCRRVGRLRQLILLYLPSHLDYGVGITLLTPNISH